MLLSEHEPGTSICEVASARKASAYSEEEGYVMLYTIGDAAKKLGVQHQLCAITIKKDFFLTWSAVMGECACLPEDDFEWFRFIERLKNQVCP